MSDSALSVLRWSRQVPLREQWRSSFQQAVGTDPQSHTGNFEGLDFILLDILVDRAAICSDELRCGGYTYDPHVLSTTRAPHLLPLN